MFFRPSQFKFSCQNSHHCRSTRYTLQIYQINCVGNKKSQNEPLNQMQHKSLDHNKYLVRYLHNQQLKMLQQLTTLNSEDFHDVLDHDYQIDFNRLICQFSKFLLYLSQARNVQLAIIKSERIKTSKTVPGHIVINVLTTNLVLNLIRLKAPILLDEASIKSINNHLFYQKIQPVNNLLCKSITRHIKYNRKNMGNESKISI